MTLVDSQSVKSAVFPPEILGRILDCLAERQFEVPLEQSQIEALQACALASRQLTQHCQGLLLERLDGINLHGPKMSGLKRLQENFNKSPQHLRVVRELAITYTPESVDDSVVAHAPDVPISTDQDLLLKFLNLTSLAIKLHASLRVLDTPIPFCAHIITTYTSQHTLRSLILENFMEAQFWPLILSSRSLKRLELNRCDLPPCTCDILNTSITRLTLRAVSMTAEQLSIISNLTCLEVLDLQHLVVPGDRLLNDVDRFPVWVPPQGLREINTTSLSRRGEVIMLDSLVCNLQRLDQDGYLSQLTTLRLRVKSEEDLDILEALLPHAPSLHNIEMRATVILPGQLAIVQRIDQAIASCQYQLTGLIMSFDIKSPGSSYNPLLIDLLSLVDTLSRSSNALEIFSIYIRLPVDASGRQPRLDEWSQIASKLALRESFPCLKQVKVEILGNAPGVPTSAQMISEFGSPHFLEGVLLTAMAELHKRADIRFYAKLVI